MIRRAMLSSDAFTDSAIKLGDMMDTQQPHVPWRNIRALGNVLRHGYDDIHDDAIWDTIEYGLTPLRDVCVAELARLDEAS